MNYHTSFQRTECFPGRNQAAFCELNEGKLPNLKCTIVVLLTYGKSQSSFYLSPHWRDVEAYKAETRRHSLLCHRASRYQQNPQGNLGLSPCKSTVPCRYSRSAMGHSTHTPTLCFEAFEFSRSFRFCTKSPRCHTLISSYQSPSRTPSVLCHL